MNVPLLSRLRRARWVHAVQLFVFATWVMNPFPGALSYWTDTNGDGVKEEVANPAEGDMWWEQDSDGDSLSNAQEALFGSDPYQIDADFDGLTDQIEHDYADPVAPFDPWNWDSDGDGFSDHDEYYQNLWGYSPQVNYLNLASGNFYSYSDADGDGTKNPEDYDFNVDRDGDGMVNWQDGAASFNGVGGEWMDDANNGVWNDPGVYIGGNWYPSGTLDSDMDGTPDYMDLYPYGSFYYDGVEYGGLWQDADADGIPDVADMYPSDANNGSPPEGYDYNGVWYAGFWQDSDYDGIPDPADMYPYDSTNGGGGTTSTDSDGDGIPDYSDSYPWGSYWYNGTEYGGSWQDSDLDGIPDQQDPWPYDASNGASGMSDSDSDGCLDGSDSHPNDSALWDDFDNDGRNVQDDSHPDTGGLWSDWNLDGDNNDEDGDEDGVPDSRDSHPHEASRANDWNNDGSDDAPGSDYDSDGHPLQDDSHPGDSSLWSDWNYSGSNNDTDGDEDGHTNANDSHPHDAGLWSDWDGNGSNNDSDGDEDGTPDAEDSHPYFAGLHNDWNGDGDDNDTDWDEDGVENGQDTSPKNAALWDDADGDGHNAADDSHPHDAGLWSDWNGDGDNNDPDGDEDGWPDGNDSHPRDAQLWSDFDGDNLNADYDSDPSDAALWSDWNHNGTNNDTDWDEDGHANEDDSDPYTAMLWSDWDHNQSNNDNDGDEDGTDDTGDSHPRDASLQSDWNFDGQNDGPGDDSDGDGRPNATDSDPLNAALWSDWDHNSSNNDADVDEDGVLNDDDSHPFDPALSTDWNFDGDDNPPDMDEDGHANEYNSPEGPNVSNSDSHPHDPNLWSDWDGNGSNNDEDGDEDGVLNINDSHPFLAQWWSDWDQNQINNDTDGDEDGVLDTQDSDPRNNALHSDWNHDGDDNEGDWDEDGYDNGTDSHPANASLWDDFDVDGINAENDSDPDNNSLWSDWNHDGDNHATDGDEDGYGDIADSDPRNPALWIDWNHDGYNDGSEPPDRDGDGLFDTIDNYPDDPYNNADSDSDGLSDYDEVFLHNTERNDVDSDDDFLTDYEELLVYHTNPTAAKSTATQSVVDGYLYLGQDTDADGLPDLLESHYHLDKDDPNDATGDLDGDGYTNLQAYHFGWSLVSNLDTYDLDGDHILDAVEDRWAAAAPGSLDKNVFADAVADFDHDGVMNFEEIALGLDLAHASTEGRADGLTDVQVLAWGLLSGAALTPSADPVQQVWQQIDAAWIAQQTGQPAESEQADAWLTQADADSDGVPDGLSAFRAQYQPPTLVRAQPADCDGDGMSDVWEYRYELALRSSGDAGQAERLYTTESLPPLMSYEDFAASWTADIDATGMDAAAAYEQMQQSRQEDLATWPLIDPDGDGLGNLREFQLGTNPRISDTDGDGENDLSEVQGGSDPTLAGSSSSSTGGTGGSSTSGNDGTTSSGSGSSSSGGSGAGTGSGSQPPPAIAPVPTSGLALFTAWRYKELSYLGGQQLEYNIEESGTSGIEEGGWFKYSEEEPTPALGNDNFNGDADEGDDVVDPGDPRDMQSSPTAPRSRIPAQMGDEGAFYVESTVSGGGTSMTVGPPYADSRNIDTYLGTNSYTPPDMQKDNGEFSVEKAYEVLGRVSYYRGEQSNGWMGNGYLGLKSYQVSSVRSIGQEQQAYSYTDKNGEEQSGEITLHRSTAHLAAGQLRLQCNRARSAEDEPLRASFLLMRETRSLSSSEATNSEGLATIELRIVTGTSSTQHSVTSGALPPEDATLENGVLTLRSPTPIEGKMVQYNLLPVEIKVDQDAGHTGPNGCARVYYEAPTIEPIAKSLFGLWPGEATNVKLGASLASVIAANPSLVTWTAPGASTFTVAPDKMSAKVAWTATGYHAVGINLGGTTYTVLFDVPNIGHTGKWGAVWEVFPIDAYNIRAAALRIEAEANRRYGTDMGKSDAVKHSAGAAYTAARWGAAAADTVGHAHEKDGYDNASSVAFNSTMDLYNNDVGITAGGPYYGSSSAAPSETDWIDACASTYDSGGLFVWWPAGHALIKPTGTNEGVIRYSDGKHVDD